MSPADERRIRLIVVHELSILYGRGAYERWAYQGVASTVGALVVLGALWL